MRKDAKKKLKIRRNDPCPCGSNKKYKNCCLQKNMGLKSSKNKGKDTENSRISNNPSHVKIEKKIGQMENLIDLGEKFGIDTNELKSKLSDLKEESEFLRNIHDRFNDHFREEGWIAYESMNHEVMINAVELADSDKFEDAEHLLIEYYDENILRLSISRLKWIEEFTQRIDLIESALEDHLEERYHASIPVILAMIDGVVTDLKPGDQRGFFAEGVEIEAWDAIAAHETGLKALQRLLSKTRKKTLSEEINIPYRNGILHGRDLGYANKKVSIKTFATLLALADGIRAIKKDEIEAVEEYEPTIIESIIKEKQSEEEFYETMNKIEAFVPRELDSDYLDSLDFDEGTPEKVLLELLELSTVNNPNFLEIAKKIDLSLEERTVQQIAGVLRKKVFQNQKITGFKFLSIIDDAISVTSIVVELNIRNGEENLFYETKFVLTYKDKEGKPQTRDIKGCSWKIIAGFGIENEIL